MKYLSIVLFSLLIFSCKSESKAKVLSAVEIINKSINVSGGKLFDNSIIQFDFRNNYYSAWRQKGKFGLTRATGNDTITFIDKLTNVYEFPAEKIIEITTNNAIELFKIKV